MAVPNQDFRELNAGMKPMPVYVFPILVQVAAPTEEEAVSYLTDSGLQDGPLVLEQDNVRVKVLYANVDEGAYGDVTLSYTVPYSDPTRAAREGLKALADSLERQGPDRPDE